MRRTNLSHREAAMVHAIRRAWQRLGLALGECDIKTIGGMINPGDGVEGGNGRTLHVVTYRGRDIHVVFCRELEQVVSFLPGPAYFKPKGSACEGSKE